MIISFRYVLLFVLGIVYIMLMFKYFQNENFTKKNNSETVVDLVSNLREPFDCLGAPCVTDANCKICKTNSNYQCIKGKCGIKEVASSTGNKKTCDESKGFYLVKRDTIFDTEWYCLNTKTHIFDDNGNKFKYICENGKSFDAKANKCECNDSHQLYILNNLPLCLEKDSIL